MITFILHVIGFFVLLVVGIIVLGVSALVILKILSKLCDLGIWWGNKRANAKRLKKR